MLQHKWNDKPLNLACAPAYVGLSVVGCKKQINYLGTGFVIVVIIVIVIVMRHEVAY